MNIFEPTYEQLRDWENSIPKFQKSHKLDLAVGWGTCINYDMAYPNFVSDIISETKDYVWVREFGYLSCLHFTKATEKELKNKGLIWSSDAELVTFTNGVYVYNSAQTPYSLSTLDNVEFVYNGPYYKCIYDCDPDGNCNKDIGVTQEYLIPVKNVPADYLHFNGKIIQTTNFFS